MKDWQILHQECRVLKAMLMCSVRPHERKRVFKKLVEYRRNINDHFNSMDASSRIRNSPKQRALPERWQQ